ncbi:hypothetical protein BDV96DRAFT_641114 [Lophiotrema nucula]|uniref:Aminoglycoside phosphotransferase domain-containing protein n=1 Tax=Lophiotrema nucula TaxID=690887 RepID=A0A6A5ZNH9_9PLEO|nr:hypothetical protein BDV96DRAFT_641114 [Lophiotrema nucula]
MTASINSFLAGLVPTVETISTHLRFLSRDVTRTLYSQDKYEIEGTDMQHVHARLERLIPKMSKHQDTEPTVLYHHDLNRSNILLNYEGDLVRIIDWQCAASGPLWQACRLPKFLERPSWPELPLDEDGAFSQLPAMRGRHKGGFTELSQGLIPELLAVSIHNTPSLPSCSHQPQFLGDIVSGPFFISDYLEQEVPAKHIRLSGEWLAARLQFAINDNSIEFNNLADAADDYDRAAIRSMRQNTGQLLRMLPTHFPDVHECFVLYHHDLSDAKVLVDGHGDLAGIVDWECITTVPLWHACQISKFLDGPDCEKLPDKRGNVKVGDGVEDDEEYLLDMKEYEITRLRKLFIEEMGIKCPEWFQVYKSKHNELKRDFDLAIETCWQDICCQALDKWLKELEAGKEPRSLALAYSSPIFEVHEAEDDVLEESMALD